MIFSSWHFLFNKRLLWFLKINLLCKFCQLAMFQVFHNSEREGNECLGWKSRVNIKLWVGYWVKIGKFIWVQDLYILSQFHTHLCQEILANSTMVTVMFSIVPLRYVSLKILITSNFQGLLITINFTFRYQWTHHVALKPSCHSLLSLH